MSERILVADDDPDILRFVELNLRLEGYEVVTAGDGAEAMQHAIDDKPDLVILDVMMPKLDGYEVCQRLRGDPRTSGVCIIMLTAKAMSADKVFGLTQGADDYLSKPFDPMELVARVRTTLRRSGEMRAASPLTGLPGNIQIENEVKRRLALGEPFALLWLDLDNFKAYNDHYGFMRGDMAINYTSRVLEDAVRADPSNFLGHIGGDDFVAICGADSGEDLAAEILKRFDEGVKGLYDPLDAERGAISVKDRLGNEVAYPLLSMSIGTAFSDAITDHRRLIEVATEMKTFAKTQEGSFVGIDRRRRDEEQDEAAGSA
ncbi:MAG TPA: response regulator [Actinomycetota bacterium]